ncbi:MAG TPA: ABC transporter permease subunit [Candidatus Hydrogenedentes bacterium]|nr:ABC transporter permease subunit [Candidatus Hydrogenedentota bacterium]
MIPVLWIIVTVVFFLVRLAPGGPFDADRVVSEDVLQNLNSYYHLDLPLYRQYLDYMARLVQGDLGPSFKNANWSVNELIALGFPVSLELGLYALVIALFLGLLAGIGAALKPNTLLDYIPMTFATLGICVPTFVLGPVLLLVFALYLHWAPVAGWDGPSHKILPSLTLGIVYAAYIARLTRGGMMEIMTQDFIRTARAKGLSEARVVLRHALRGGVRPVVSFLGPAAAGLLSGSFVVETIFHVPGLGRFFVQSAFNRDYTMIMGTVLFYAVLILLFNLFVDIVLAWIDPRIRGAS